MLVRAESPGFRGLRGSTRDVLSCICPTVKQRETVLIEVVMPSLQCLALHALGGGVDIGALTGQAANLVQFALWTGLRTSELVALDWSDVDWIRGEVMITKALTQAAKGVAEMPKTAAGRRAVKLLGPALAALKAQKDHTFLAGNEVFQNPRTLERWAGDGPIRKTMWAHAVKKAGVRYRRPYQTRHTYASMMLSAGEHPMWVAQQMGHSDWTMIARVYGRWMPGADPTAGSKAESVFQRPDTATGPRSTASG